MKYNAIVSWLFFHVKKRRCRIWRSGFTSTIRLTFQLCWRRFCSFNLFVLLSQKKLEREDRPILKVPTYIRQMRQLTLYPSKIICAVQVKNPKAFLDSQLHYYRLRGIASNLEITKNHRFILCNFISSFKISWAAVMFPLELTGSLFE